MMRALEAILRRPRTVLTLMIVLVIAGTISYLTIPKEADPDIPVPIFTVTIIHNGISPEDSERLLIKPMETQLRSLEGLKELTATAGQNYGVLVVQFEAETDQETAGRDVREKVDLAKSDLPAGAEEPVVKEVNLSLVPVIVATFYGEVPERTLYNHVRRLKDRIEAIPTVLEANLTGHREEVLEVIIDAAKMQSYAISQPELIAAMSRNNQLVPAGALDTGTGRFNIKVPGLFEKASDVYSLPVKVSGDRVVTLKDVAQIRRTFKDAAGYARYNGKPAIAIQIIKRLGANIVENNEAVRQTVAEFTREWPKAIHIDFTLDQSGFVFESLNSLQSSILTAIALVMVIVVAALGLRSALLVGIAIPTSFMIGFLGVAFLGLTVNMMVMFGLVLTVGILVDGAIVIVEYADRKLDEGMEGTQAYILAAKRMFWPVFSSTATTLAAFMPMLLWPGVAGKFMSFLPITVIVVLTASFVTAMVFLPVLGTSLWKIVQVFTPSSRRQKGAADNLPGSAARPQPAIHAFEVKGPYARIINVLIWHPLKVVLSIALLISVIIQSFGYFGKGVEFIPAADFEQAVVFVRARGNLSALEKLDLTQQVEKIVLGVNGVRSAFTSAGASGGLDFGPNTERDAPRDTIGRIYLEFHAAGSRPPGKEILEDIRRQTAALAGIYVDLQKKEEGPPTGKDIRLQILSDKYDRLKTVVARVRQYFDEEAGELRDIEDDRPLPGIEWELKVDREEAGRFGTDVASVGGVIQLVTNGILIGTYRPQNAEDEIDIRARFPKNERSIHQLDRLRIHTPKGLVPISNLVKREAHQRVSSISRSDGLYSMYLKANVTKGVMPDAKIKQIEKWLKTRDWPPGVSFKFRGADEEQKKSAAFLQKAMMGALFLMFIILLTQFNSFYQTFLTLMTVVLSVVGVLIGMMVMGQTFSVIMTGTGVVALAGIVVNNAIVLLDTFNRFKQEGMDMLEAVVLACSQRLRPVLLTTITTMIGLAPMMLGMNVNFLTRSIGFGGLTAGWWVPLATAIIFGLGFATVLTLVLTPVMLAAPEVYRRKWRALNKRRAWRRQGRQAEAGPSSEPEAGDTAEAKSPPQLPQAAQ